MKRLADQDAFHVAPPALRRGDFLRDPSGRLFRVVEKTTVTDAGPYAFELVEAAACDSERVFDICKQDCAAEGATAAQAAAGADLTDQEPVAEVKAGVAAGAGDSPSPACDRTDGRGFPPTHSVRPVLTVDQACDRLNPPVAVVARCVALHDRIADGEDFFMHLLERQARRIGQGALFREAMKLAGKEA